MPIFSTKTVEFLVFEAFGCHGVVLEEMDGPERGVRVMFSGAWMAVGNVVSLVPREHDLASFAGRERKRPPVDYLPHDVFLCSRPSVTRP